MSKFEILEKKKKNHYFENNELKLKSTHYIDRNISQICSDWYSPMLKSFAIINVFHLKKKKNPSRLNLKFQIKNILCSLQNLFIPRLCYTLTFFIRQTLKDRNCVYIVPRLNFTRIVFILSWQEWDKNH